MTYSTFGIGNNRDRGIPNIMTADGPAGVRIMPQLEVYTTAWPCATMLASTWNRELVEEVAKRSGFSQEFIEENGEYANARSSLLFYWATAKQHTMENLSMHDQIYIVQTKIIEELAEKGDCVIVGRCADYILRDRKDCLHAFICADMQSRAKHIVEYYGQCDKSPEKRLTEKDQKRKVYYKNYTGRNWGEAKNYDVCLNSGVLGMELCVRLIEQAARME